MRRVFVAVLLALSLVGPTWRVAVAAPQNDIDQLNAEIKKRKDAIGEIDGMISSTRNNIQKQQSEVVNLQNEIALLENRIKEKDLAVQRTQIEIDELTLEIRLADQQIELHENRIAKDRDLTTALIQRMNEEDATTPFDALLANGSLSEAFTRFEEIRNVGRDLETTLGRVKEERAEIEAEKQQKKSRQETLETARANLEKEKLGLETEEAAKASLIAETNEKQQEFERILYELRQQEQSTSDEISGLEGKLKAQLESIDDLLARGDTTLSWPISTAKGITAIFHDPTYPFRYLFEHPGTDIRASVGTPIHAAAGGYVAWNKTGRQYGNYTMIVHANGMATVYGHLSKFLAKPDTFVERGEIIGLTGGAPGTPGAGLSTGAHLHFEVRKDGIPVDPENYTPQVSASTYDSYEEYKALGIRL